MNKLFIYRVSLRLFLLFSIILFAYPTKSSAITDDFTSDPRFNPNWSVQNPDGLKWDNPGITLSKLQAGSFPYLRTTSSFSSTTDKYYEIRFQYISTGSPWGVGGSFTDNPPNYSTSLNTISDYLNYNVSYFFGEKLHVVSALCPSTSDVCTDSWWFVYPNLIPSNTYLSSTPVDNSTHTFSILRKDVGINTYTYRAYLDEKLLFESKNTSRLVNSVWLGHPSYLGGLKDWPTLKIYSVKSLPDIPDTFPYLSQKDPLWGSKEYDSASSWAGVNKSGIDRWGCALTSVAMVLQNNNIKTSTGDTVNPDNLNAWLKSQPDGYIGPGLLNWLAVTRFAKQSYDAGKAPNKLEYTRSYLPTSSMLPAILSTGSHFVVAHGEDATNWNINDPANVNNKTFAKTTSIKSVNRFVESKTDLSYMMFVSDPADSAVLKDGTGNPVDIAWTEESLGDDVETSTPSNVKIGMFAKPTTGNYLLTVNRQGTDTGEVKVYLYDQLATPTIQTVNLDKEETTVRIDYSKDNSEDDVIVEVDLAPPPVPTILTPASGAYVKPSGLFLDWSDVSDLSIPVTYNYKSSWNDGTYGPVSTGTNSQIDASGTSDGEYMWRVQACDNVGNCSLWSAPTKVIVDSVAPSTDIVFPTPGPSSNYFEVVYSELVNPLEATGAANYYLSNWPGAGGSGDLVGDADITYDPNNKTAHILFTNPGWYISPEQLWGVQNIHDLAGNLIVVNPYTEYSTKVITPLITRPTPPTSPSSIFIQDWSWLPGTDVGSGIKGYSTRTYNLDAEAYLDDWLWIGNVLSTTTTLNEGRWQLSLKATDMAGNVSETQSSGLLLLDFTKPQLTLNAWGSTIDGTASDSLSGIHKVTIYIKKPNGDENTVTAQGTSHWTYTMSEAPLGNYKIVINAYDIAGNKSIEITKDFVMRPASLDNNRSSSDNNSAVFGAATTVTKSMKSIASPTPLLQTITDEIEREEKVEVLPKEGNVLGETDEQSPKSNTYLRIFGGCTLVLLALLGFIFLARKRS